MPERPNVVFIMADQHNAKCTGWGEYPEEVHTPHLERLASEGVRFDRCFAQNPICTPSRTSFLTGQYPSNHGYFGLSSRYGDAPTEIPGVFEIAQRLGYRTGAFGKLHVPHGLFDPYIDVIQATHASPVDAERKTPFDAYLDGRGLERDWPGTREGRPHRHDRADLAEYWALRGAQSFIAGGDDPFCLWLTLRPPHGPYVPAEEFWELYPDAEDLDVPPSVDEDLSDKPPIQARARDSQRQAAEEDDETPPFDTLRRKKLRGYLGSISMVDDCVGRMLDYLEAQGLREDTIVVYTADHGDFALEHGNIDKAPGISYDAITRIPFVWSWPGQFEEGAVRSELVESVDLLPTLVDLMAGGGAVESADGRTITGLLTGEDVSPVREYAITENAWAKCVRTEDEKLTIYPRGFFGSDAEEYREFYDMEEDPWETTNLAVEDPEAVADAVDRHRQYLYEFTVTTNRPLTIHPERADGRSVEWGDTDVFGDTPSINPAHIRAHLDEYEGANYL